MNCLRRLRVERFLLVLTCVLFGVFAMGGAAMAQVTAFKQAVAEAAAADDDIATFYRTSGYAPLWTGDDPVHLERRAALMQALDQAEAHGLPAAKYDRQALLQQMGAARSTRDLGLIEVALSETYLTYARDIQTGLLTPSRIDDGLVRAVPYRPRLSYLSDLAKNSPQKALQALAPQTAQYRGLMKQKMKLEAVLVHGGWGPTVSGKMLEPGDEGPAVVALRDRLIAMGFMPPNARQSYDAALETAVRAFQASHGLETDGVAGSGTLAEINTPVETRLKSVIVAMERERWINQDLGARHILVNQTDFSAKIVDHGRITFQTRSVIGKNTSDRRSPEFSDVMEHMVINPSWYVPRSIITKEYLPQLQSNPNAVGHLEITDSRGRRVNRAAVDFTQYSARSFPYAMRQPPSQRNALGLVKFMFPNKYNIYLHDTPQKHLFSRETRAYSHGCIRLADPFDFAYALLARQQSDPEAFFQRILRSGKETKVDLEVQVPVHIIYRTAFVTEKGETEYRRDVYGRDAKIWSALNDAGVVLRGVQG